MTKQELATLIKGVQKKDRLSQKRLYLQFCDYSMTVCARYARSDQEAEEIVNEVFFKVITKIDTYSPQHSFITWLHTITVRTAIDYLRANKQAPTTDNVVILENVIVSEDILDHLSTEEILQLVRKLPPAYRATFNLYVVEGYSHSEIAEALGVTEGTSRSNLMAARQKLQAFIIQSNKVTLQ